MNNLLSSTKLFLSRNGSTILTCIGSVGVIATSVMAAKATPKALSLLENAKEEKGEELTKLETVRTATPAYVATIIIGASTIACMFGSNSLNKRQQAAMMSAYALLNTSYKEYRNKIKELHGDEFDTEVRAEIAKDNYKGQEIEDEDDGKTLFYDEYSKRYFRAKNETVLRAKYEINKEVNCNFYATINELYDILEIPHIDGGDEIGWSSAMMYEMYWTDWVDFRLDRVELEDGMECYILQYTEPFLDFDEY